MSDLVQARWACSYPVEVAGQGIIAPGDIALIPTGEATNSENWQPVELDDLKKDELVELAQDAGVPAPASKSKAKLATEISKATREESS